MRRAFVIFLFAALIMQRAAASGNEVEAALNQQYKKKNYSLRHPVTANSQRFDSSGRLLSGGREGPWTVYSRLNIRKIKLSPNRLTLDADRICYGFDKRQKRLVPMKLGGSVSLEIALDQPLTSSEQANAVLDRVFAFSKENFLASMPLWWRVYMDEHLEGSPGDGSDLQMKEMPEWKPESKISGPPVKDENGIYRGGAGMTSPKPVFTPDPDYNDLARKARLSGSNTFQFVVDDAGKVAGFNLVQPLGLGLDEQAVVCFQTWTFRPAMLEEKPVKTRMIVETHFNLY